MKPVSAGLTYADEGKLTVALNDGGKLTLVMVLKQNMLYLDDPAGSIAGVKLVPASDFPKARDFNAERGMKPYELLADGWRIVLSEKPGVSVHIRGHARV